MTEYYQHIIAAICILGIFIAKDARVHVYGLVFSAASLNVFLAPLFEKMVNSSVILEVWHTFNYDQAMAQLLTYAAIYSALALIDAFVMMMVKNDERFGNLIRAALASFVFVNVMIVTRILLWDMQFFTDEYPVLALIDSIYFHKSAIIDRLNELQILILIGGLSGWSFQRIGRLRNAVKSALDRPASVPVGDTGSGSIRDASKVNGASK